MSRILLADHSPHAQRMGERILRDEGFEVAAVTDGETALVRLKDLAPDLILADISLPSRNGYEICEYVKTSGKYPTTRVVLTAGPITTFDEARAGAAGSDGFVRKPFEASILLGVVQPLLEKDEKPAQTRPPEPKAAPAPPPAPVAPQPRPVDREQIRAGVILALEESMITIIENLTDKVTAALEADARSAAEVRESKPAPLLNRAAAAPAAQSTESPAQPKPGPSPDEPVVRIRTPMFRTL